MTKYVKKTQHTTGPLHTVGKLIVPDLANKLISVYIEYYIKSGIIIQWVQEPLSPGVKQSGREADHSFPASAKGKKMWIYTSTPPHVFME
jgi:hypothetical protein